MYQETFLEAAQKLEVSTSILFHQTRLTEMQDKSGLHKFLADTGFPFDKVSVTAAVFTNTNICRYVLHTDSASLCSPFVVYFYVFPAEYEVISSLAEHNFW